MKLMTCSIIHYLMTACQVFGGDVAREALALLWGMPQPPFEASLIEPALTVFLNALAQSERGGIPLSPRHF